MPFGSVNILLTNCNYFARHGDKDFENSQVVYIIQDLARSSLVDPFCMKLAYPSF